MDKNIESEARKMLNVFLTDWLTDHNPNMTLIALLLAAVD